VENTATGLIAPEKSPDQIERDMADTRDSITEKVVALETQVKGNIEAVTGTVEAVKDAISAAPAAVSDTVKQTVAVVKDSFRETLQSLDFTDRVRRNPWAALGASTAAGFLTGFFLSSGRSRSANGVARASFAPQAATAESEGPGFLERTFGDLFGTVGKELRIVAEQAITSAVTALKQNVGTVVPQMVDQAVHRVADPVTGAIGGNSPAPRMMDSSGV
jgi:ElaB/YqjD/DUF883 family membrane-anchored ribosome-binding protein